MMQEESPEVWEMIGRKLSGNELPEDAGKLASWLQEKPEHAALFGQLKAYWLQQKPLNYSPEAMNTAWQRLQQKGVEPASPAKPPKSLDFIPSKSWRYAAIWVAILISLAGLWLALNRSTEPQTGDLAYAEAAERMQVLLADGTMVWLNAGSKLTYPTAFGDSIRQVSLVGEAYFEVISSPERPFIIQLDKGQVKVLGTKFNVRSKSDEPIIETSVISGQVAFIAPDAEQKAPLLLSQNKRAVYDRNSGQLTVSESESALDAAWKDDVLSFQETSFGEVSRILQKRFKTIVHLQDPTLANCRFTATFTDESLEELLEILLLTGDYSYKLANDTISISGQGCP